MQKETEEKEDEDDIEEDVGEENEEKRKRKGKQMQWTKLTSFIPVWNLDGQDCRTLNKVE